MTEIKDKIINIFKKSDAGSSLTLHVYSKDDLTKLDDIVQLDAAVFGQDALKLDDLQAMLIHDGAVLGVRDSSGGLIAEASLALKPDEENGDCQLIRKMPKLIAYSNGVAVHSDHEGKGLEKLLLQLREQYAKHMKKGMMVVAARPYNFASLSSLMGDSQGYLLLTVAPNFFEDDRGRSRLIMAKLLGYNNPMQAMTSEYEGMKYEDKGITKYEDVAEAINDSTPVISIRMDYGESIDNDLFNAVQKLTGADYVGVSCRTPNIGDSTRTPYGVIVFLDTKPIETDIFPILTDYKKSLDAIFKVEA